MDRIRGCLLGLAVGDAVGTSVEFKARGSFALLTDMVGGGPFNLQAGQWTDDTSMALCLTSSLVECDRFDTYDQMIRYVRWAEEGYLSSTGTCFDIGGTVSAALRKFQKTGEPFAGSTDPRSAGNGSIMRLAPIPMFYYPDIKAAQYYAMESSRTTHGAEECLDACRLLAGMIVRALAGKSRDEVILAEAESFAGSPKIVSLAMGSYLHKSEGSIRGSGYVVESLEAALWCFMKTQSYKEAVLRAANLGDDADTTAAVCGQLAGAYYGETGIPPSWLEKLAMRVEITDLAEKLVYKPNNSERSVQ
ncbi:MAG: ADP-ribosylglycohydrolase family protein [Anaerolineales bacterium]